MAHTPENATSLFARFLASREAGHAIDFEALVVQHPECEAELRALKSRDDAVEDALKRDLPSPEAGGPSFFHRSRGPSRSGVDSGVPGNELGPGDTLGTFTLIRVLGCGGMGRVFEAWQSDMRRHVALKLVLPERMDARSLELFAREARAGGRLSHVGIIGVHGFGATDGVHWINQELVEGGWTLRDFIEETRRSGSLQPGYYRRVAELVVRLAEALQAAHNAGVIHRDIKPQNILIAPDDTPKIGDFGLARITGETALTATGDFAGTYLYMSPEQVAARRMGLDHRSDIFSLGVVLYELLGLQRPFEGDTAHQIAEKILTWDPPDLHRQRSRIPADLSVIAGKMLEKRPSERYPSMSDVAADIGRYLRNEPILAKAPGILRRTRKWAQRNPTKSLVGTVTAVAFVAISLLGLRLDRTNRELSDRELETRQKTDDVLRLSLLQNLDDLVAAADDLWPPAPQNIGALEGWIRKANALAAELPSLIAKRDELRLLALPRTQNEREAERRSHPEFPHLEQLEGEITAARRALEVRLGSAPIEVPELDWAQYPKNPNALNSVAWGLVRPDREIFGREPVGVALAARAVDGLVGEDKAACLDTLARGRLALGDDRGAVEASTLALASAPETVREEYEGYLREVSAAAEEASSPEGLASAEGELATLENDRAQLDERLGERRTWTFPRLPGEGNRTRWWHNQIDRLVYRIEALADPATGLASPTGVDPSHGWSIPHRLASATLLATGFESGGTFAQRWERALPGIGNSYADLDLTPQTGLVPLGPDPTSGLWEFWHILSGEEPARDSDGSLVLDESSGLVFVLLPAGAYRMGAQRSDPESHNFDPDAENNEAPVHSVELGAFFLSKFEMTQEVWERLAGHNPSAWTSNTLSMAHATCLPVEQVSWFECMTQLARAGLTLPTEAQWEYACRAGTETPRPFAIDAFGHHANIADESFRVAFAAARTFEKWDDGMSRHGPVGSLLPNAFGLHDMLGNLWEWCLDGYDNAIYATSPLRDPLSPPTGDRPRICRGGSFTGPAAHARSAIRFAFAPAGSTNYVGVRPARAIEE